MPGSRSLGIIVENATLICYYCSVYIKSEPGIKRIIYVG